MYSQKKTAVGRRGHARPAGRTRLQQEQKEATRDKLLRAAEMVFADLSYVEATVADIIQRAGASRTSFYRHFDSKWAVASALCGEVMPAVWRLWHELAAYRQPSEVQVIGWLERRLELYRSHSVLFETLKEAVAIEPVGLHAVNATHDQTIEVLAQGIPAFALATGKDPSTHEIQIRAHLLMIQLDEFNYLLAVRGWNVDRALATQVMARQFLRFIEETDRDAAAR
jgi:AcrR family transcriptional regulator